MTCPGELIAIDDTSLWVVIRGEGYPILILHGGPGIDHHTFGDYLDPLTEGGFQLVLVDQRSQGRSEPAPVHTWSLERMSQDVIMLARALGFRRYAVLGHSFGAFVTLQNAVDFPGMASQSIVSSGLPSMRYLEHVWANLDSFEPEHLCEQVRSSWERELTAVTQEDVASIMSDQAPFHFADPLDPRILEYERRTAGAIYPPDVGRHFAASDYGGIDLEARLEEVRSPTLVLAGRHDRTCVVEASEAIAKGIPMADLVVFENSAHMTFVEEQELYLSAVRSFLERYV